MISGRTSRRDNAARRNAATAALATQSITAGRVCITAAWLIGIERLSGWRSFFAVCPPARFDLDRNDQGCPHIEDVTTMSNTAAAFAALMGLQFP